MKKFRAIALSLLIGVGLVATAAAGPVSPSSCPNCVLNSPLAQDAQINIGTATIRGTLTVSTFTSTNLSASTLTITTNIYGPGSQLTNLNASQLASGTVPLSRLSGSYTGITGLGNIAAGTWLANVLGIQYGGTGQNFVTVSTGSIPYFSATGVMAALAPNTVGKVLQTNGAGASPTWTNAPPLIGTSFTGIPPATGFAAGTLPTNVAVQDGSLSSVSGNKITGNISGTAGGLSSLLPIVGIASGTLPTSIAASSITPTGVAPGTYPATTSRIPQLTILSDGRISAVSQSDIGIVPTQVNPGTFPSGVLLPATNVDNGILGVGVIAQTLPLTGVSSGTYGGPTQLSAFHVRTDGRIDQAAQYFLNITSATMDNNWVAPQTFQSSITVKAEILAYSSVTASAFFGDGSHLSGIVSTAVLSGYLPLAGGTVTGNLGVTGAGGETITYGVTAGSFTGNGSALTNLSASNIDSTSGPLGLLGPNGYFFAASSMTASAFFGDGSHLTGISGGVSTGVVTTAAFIGNGNSSSPLGANSSSVTLQGNSFNGNSQLVKTTSGGLLPVLSGANLTSLTAANIASGSLGSGVVNTNAAIGDLSGSYPNPTVIRTQTGSVDFSTITTALAGKLNLTGGTMTGPLLFTGASGYITSGSSVNASAFFGDGSHLTGIPSTSSISGMYVLRAGDTMTGNLLIQGSTLTVGGPIVSSGTSGGIIATGAGTRFEWVPSLSAIRAGEVSANNWDTIGQYSVGFGFDSLSTAAYSSVLGGHSNHAAGLDSVAVGGFGNTAWGSNSFVGGGVSNEAKGANDAVVGGQSNLARGGDSFVGGGNGNNAAGSLSTVGGGNGNEADDVADTVSGGSGNAAYGQYSTVVGGLNSTASGVHSAVLGGQSNAASAESATVLGGNLNTASGQYSIAGGLRAKATHNGSAVFSDSTNADYNSTATNSLNFRYTGGTYFAASVNGVSVLGSSVTAASFFGDGSHLTGVIAGVSTGVVTNASMIGNGNSSSQLGVNSSSVAVLSGGFVLNTQLNPSIVTKQGNVFNGASQLTQLDGLANLDLPSGLLASSATLTATGNSQYDLQTSSGILINGQVVAQYFVGDGSALSNLPCQVSGTGDIACYGSNPSVSGFYSFVAGGANNTSSGNESFTAGSGNNASGFAASIPGGFSNTAAGSYSSAFGRDMNNQGTNTAAFGLDGAAHTVSVNNDFIVMASSFGINTLAPNATLDVTGSIIASSSITASTFNAVGSAYMMNGTVVIDHNFNIFASSVNASGFFGDGSHLTGITGTTPGGSASGDLSGSYPSPLVSHTQSGSVDFSTITTALNGKLSNTIAISPILIDLSTVTTALSGKLSNTAAISPVLVDLSTVTSALTGKLSTTAPIPNGLVDLSTVTTALSVKASSGTNGDITSITALVSINTSLALAVVSTVTVTGQYASAESTTTITLNWMTGNVQYINLANSGQTFTFSGPLSGGRYALILVQPYSGAAGTVTWPTNVLWSGGTAPTLTATNGKTDVISCIYDGNNSRYYCGSSLNF